MAQQINDVLSTKTPEEVDWFLSQFAKGLKEQGAQHVSLKLLCNRRQPWAKCTPCDKAFTIEEIKEAGGCPDCGQDGDFEAPECFVRQP
jgi:hypothetical protein